MCTCYMWMSQVVVRVVEPAMERVPEIVMVAIVCQSLNPSQKQVYMRYVYPPIHGEWHETLHARSPDPSALFFARRVWLARLQQGRAGRGHPRTDHKYEIKFKLHSLPPQGFCKFPKKRETVRF